MKNDFLKRHTAARNDVPKMPDGRTQPLDGIKWVHRDWLKPNNYNPNSVAGPELRLLKLSILEDGWTQPIVANPDGTIVDGFHRWTISGHPEMQKLTGGLVPVVVLEPENEAHQQMSTIRHNRARGTHAVLKMGDIVKDLKEQGLSDEEIQERLQMDRDEVARFKNIEGIFEGIDDEFSKSWTPEEKTNGETEGKKVNKKGSSPGR